MPEEDTILFCLSIFTRFKILTPDFLIKYYNQDLLTPIARKQKKARKPREAKMLSDIKNLHIMLGGNRLEREESEYDNSSRRSNIPNLNTHGNNEENHYHNSMENRSSNSAEYRHISAGTDSSAEFNRLSGELNLRISREMDEMMNEVRSKGPLVMQ